jgi:hypothetical protein
MAKKPIVEKAIKKTERGKETGYTERFSHIKKKGKHKSAKTDSKDR